MSAIHLASDENATWGHAGSFAVTPERDPAPDTDAPADGAFAATLAPGAHLPVRIDFAPAQTGDVHDALIIDTADEADPDPRPWIAVHADPDTARRVIVLHGVETAPGRARGAAGRRLRLRLGGPRERALRHDRQPRRRPLGIASVALSADWDGGFQIVDAPAEGGAVDGGTTSVVALRFSPAAAGEARCGLTIATDDPAAPLQTVRLFANRDTDAGDVAPFVAIHAPLAGSQHQGRGPIALDVTVSDPDQPASTLTCRIRSAYQLGNDAIAACTPTDAGRFTVDVPIAALSPGPDVLVLQATDGFGATRKASVPVLIDATWPADDEDGDGFPWSGVSDGAEVPIDCDDGDITTYPFAVERADGRDNDCDGRIDEETEAGDDDGDGISELQGDCDDADPAVYPSAPELADARDNDCDGIVDEGTDTYDDDRDGFSELDRDCDDADPAVHPGAIERCDNGIDDDCNGRTDGAEACVAALDAPRLVGGIDLDRTAVELGGAIVASVRPFVPSGSAIRHEWAMQDGLGAFDDARDARVVWTAPEALPGGATHATLRLSYLGEDRDGNQLIAFTDVDVYAPGLLAPSIKVDAGGGCATFPGGSALGLAAAAGISLRRSRRQRQGDGDRGLDAQDPPAEPDRVASRA